MGKSWGGGVALQTALDHPERVEKLILTAPALSALTGWRILPAGFAGLGEDDPVIPITLQGTTSRVPRLSW
jgi:pimeloyl-ACP methyl ester carboxylesterase